MQRVVGLVIVYESSAYVTHAGRQMYGTRLGNDREK